MALPLTHDLFARSRTMLGGWIPPGDESPVPPSGPVDKDLDKEPEKK